MKIVVYTAIFGDKDDLKKPIEYLKDKDIEYLCFTDNKKIKSDVYKVVLVKPKFSDLTKSARHYKIKGFDGMEKYDVAIWHDANMSIKHRTIKYMSSFVENADFAVFKSAYRDCVYEEGLACIAYNKDYALRVFLQLFVFFLIRYPNTAELLMGTGVFVTNIRNYRKKGMHNYWWRWIKYLSRRDQLSIGISALKTQTVWKHFPPETFIKHLPGNKREGKFVVIHKHKHENYKDKSYYYFFNNNIIVFLCNIGVKVMMKLDKHIKTYSRALWYF